MTVSTRCLCDRNGDAAVSDSKLDKQRIGLTRKLDVEGDVLRHVRRPLVVATREPFVPALGRRYGS